MTEESDSSSKSNLSGLISRWLRVSAAAMVAIALFWVSRNSPVTPMRIAGACLMISGLAPWFVAQIQLGDSFSVQPQARHLVTHGIYSRIRNPIYVFSAILLTGVALFIGKPAYTGFLLVLIPIQIIRARREARVLEEKFGDEYREYRRRTWF